MSRVADETERLLGSLERDSAFVEEYGLEGLYGVASVNRVGASSSRSPYTSSVEMWW